jgi:hypothetical protein
MADDVAGMFLPPPVALKEQDPAVVAGVNEELARLAGGGRAADFYRSLGALKSVQLVGEEERPAGRVLTCRTTFERGAWLHAFTMDSAGGVSSVTLQPE